MKSPENSSVGLRKVIYGFKEEVSGSGYAFQNDEF